MTKLFLFFKIIDKFGKIYNLDVEELVNLAGFGAGTCCNGERTFESCHPDEIMGGLLRWWLGAGL